MSYVYETHLHTVEASACGKVPGKDYITYMQDLDYAGIIVTDHFFNGNSRISRELPWKERVEQYCSGFEHALAASDGTDFTVLFGIEYNFQGDEYLLYGVDKDWLLNNPNIMSKTRSQVYETVHEGGGIMIQAHPVCDGAEVYNAANPDDQNARAYQFALDQKLIMTAGSDIHYFHQKSMGGMRFDMPIRTIQEYAKAVLEGKGTPVSIRDIQDPDRHFEPVTSYPELMHTDILPSLPVAWH